MSYCTRGSAGSPRFLTRAVALDRRGGGENEARLILHVENDTADDLALGEALVRPNDEKQRKPPVRDLQHSARKKKRRKRERGERRTRRGRTGA